MKDKKSDTIDDTNINARSPSGRKTGHKTKQSKHRITGRERTEAGEKNLAEGERFCTEDNWEKRKGQDKGGWGVVVTRPGRITLEW